VNIMRVSNIKRIKGTSGITGIKKFKCPKCGGRIAEEVMVNVTQTTTIEGVDEDGILIWGKGETEGGKASCFQCHKCGKVVRDKEDKPITTMKEMALYILGQGK
jgi:predicted RNA-binding Zn-ribbon protein involved in translation (DUF1610 family)